MLQLRISIKERYLSLRNILSKGRRPDEHIVTRTRFNWGYQEFISDPAVPM
jgi:hypothetical protein